MIIPIPDITFIVDLFAAADANLFPYEESVDIYEKFFKVHPNGSESVTGFLAVHTAVSEHSRSICMSSYRCKPVQEVLPAGAEVDFSCPDNYMWFLEHIQKEKKLGWMDFVANVGVSELPHWTSYRIHTWVGQSIREVSHIGMVVGIGSEDF